jgi:hypothetical protein
VPLPFGFQGIGDSWRKKKSAFVANQTTSRKAAAVTASIIRDKEMVIVSLSAAIGVFLPRQRASQPSRLLPVTLLRTTAQGAGFESSLEMTNTAKIRSVTVGIFDNAHDLEQAVAQLASAGFDGTAVYDEAIVAQEPGNVAPVGPVLAPGVVPAEVAGSVERDVRDVPNTVSAFKSHLADYDLPDQMIEAYTTTFYHGGKFVSSQNPPSV